jgi:alkanesulfonate monooxygenase SsuD/methylene tetrahydromethanopterin reductase-like flavin-dependent oxidoreductase (luciferase family)
MKFGLFDHVDRGAGTIQNFYENRLRVAEKYDKAGFYAYHTAEHHATTLGMASSPNVYLSAVAQRTKQLKFGPLVYCLPQYHPIPFVCLRRFVCSTNEWRKIAGWRWKRHLCY